MTRAPQHMHVARGPHAGLGRKEGVGIAACRSGLATRAVVVAVLLTALGAGAGLPGPSPASAQLGGVFGRRDAKPPAQPPQDRKIITAADQIPEPLDPSQIPPAQIALPTEPIDPYLLPKEAGPFMVLAHTFRGPDAAAYAQLLAMELRKAFGLPAWVYYQKIKPGGSNIQGVPPTVTEENAVAEQSLKGQERYRIYDEAAVLVGECASVDEGEALLKKVKKLKPECLQHIPTILPWRKKDLSRAILTVNPYVPAEKLMTRKKDPLIDRMNQGPYSILKNPGPFTLQVVEFSGRSAYMLNGDRLLQDKESFKDSPLNDAADNAVRLAERLASDPEFRKLGIDVYVYHDRNSSRVTVGALPTDNPDDPRSLALAKKMMEIVTRLSVEGLDPAKLQNKVDGRVARAGLAVRLTNDLFGSKKLDAPIIFTPTILPVPR
ncbi:hypothetical protein Isop_3421 [Isosphaera pallida ATCC 43644]|uniref:Uncharacterized protein n=1 Tax=Isosphaera pallida (strain ATCC 43644 / DSM 9630 / IS1B) TaxID=575540 RepID=E8R6S7_ISOPI|nr:hypothetical protein [Isosphaera pallida]ADV63979.1 hypothetical protein Isop_3421 [Isosphaera pallida ATCC 43644]